MILIKIARMIPIHIPAKRVPRSRIGSQFIIVPFNSAYMDDTYTKLSNGLYTYFQSHPYQIIA
jgi:hypothetical protein